MAKRKDRAPHHQQPPWPRRQASNEPARSSLPGAFSDLLKVERRKEQDIIPLDARSGRWEDHHEFHRSAPPVRRMGGMVVSEEPPLALVCPECSLRQAPIGQAFTWGGSRWHSCPYCGLTMTVHGSRLFWWR